MTQQGVTEESSGPLPLSFSLPEGFNDIDLAQPAESRANELFARLKASLPHLNSVELLHVLRSHQIMVEAMVAEGVRFAANFLGRSERDPSAVTTALFTVVVRKASLQASRPLEAVAQSLRRDHMQRQVNFVDLSIGRCLGVIEENLLTRSASLTGEKVKEKHRVRQIQLIAPIAEHGALVFFGLSTELLRDWDNYIAMMAGICKTISWSETESTTIGSVLDGGI